MLSSKEAIVLLNMGGPNNLDEVGMFLKNMFNDKNILTMKSSLLRKFIAFMITFSRTKHSQKIYEQIGGKSPIVGHTKRLVQKLQKKVGEDIVVDFVMRYTPPFADEVIKKLKKDGVEKIYLIPMYPQYSATTTKSSLEDFYDQCAVNDYDVSLVEIEHFFENQNYNKAILNSIKNSMKNDNYKDFDLIFSAHGLPQKIIDAGDIYEKHMIKHVEFLKDMLKDEEMKFNDIHLAYQSKIGPMQWLKPSLGDKLKSIKNKKVVIFPIAFTIDNSETDFELEIEYREVAQEFGYEDYKVCRCANDSNLFVDALYEIYKQMNLR